jgi:hypothetical protein
VTGGRGNAPDTDAGGDQDIDFKPLNRVFSGNLRHLLRQEKSRLPPVRHIVSANAPAT